jgi:dihydroorotase
MQKLLLKSGNIFDGEQFFKSDLLIENGKICKIGQIEENDALYIDVSNCIVSSGFIDIHTHLSEMGSSKFGFPADMATIPFGVIYAVDACALRSNFEVLDNLCVEMKVFIPLQIQEETLNFERMEEMISSYKERVIGIKVFFDVSQEKQISVHHLRLASDFAKKKNLKVMVHSTGSPIPMKEIVRILRRGDILTHAYHGGVNTIDEEDYAAYKIAKEKGIVVDAGMAGGVHTDFEVLKMALQKGYIPDTISSDITKWSAYIRGGIYGLPMCMNIMKTLGMDESKILQAVTKNAAKAVGNEEWFGLQVGNDANITVLKYEDFQIDITDQSGHQIVTNKGYKCKMTIKKGQIVYRN